MDIIANQTIFVNIAFLRETALPTQSLEGFSQKGFFQLDIRDLCSLSNQSFHIWVCNLASGHAAKTKTRCWTIKSKLILIGPQNAHNSWVMKLSLPGGIQRSKTPLHELFGCIYSSWTCRWIRRSLAWFHGTPAWHCLGDTSRLITD